MIAQGGHRPGDDRRKEPDRHGMDAIGGALLRAAERHGVAAPVAARVVGEPAREHTRT
ncbi:hypothetical protein GCM10010384_19880 [Streptomyces djakartensis]|uniref:Ketopantoate reductase C-terminal domain-containing protein n=1 Tax=Streptomyces djakartensis TaxID=68193 RepID=A0ABQ2ZFY8_9ACTN|nr:hypothetical protein GCM10010384_19880 [Streptomyces djakartensis]